MQRIAGEGQLECAKDCYFTGWAVEAPREDIALLREAGSE